MKKPLKVGDRVRVYEAGCVFTGTIANTSKGRGITEGGPANVVFVEQDLPELFDKKGWYHPKQCRRLIPPKARREWELRGGRGAEIIITAGESLHPGETVRVREVKRKGGGG